MSNGGFYNFRFLLFLGKLSIEKFRKKSGLFFRIEDIFVNLYTFFNATLVIQKIAKIFARNFIHVRYARPVF